MFAGGSWVVRAITNPAYSLDCSPERLGNNKWSPQVTIYSDGETRTIARTLSAKAIAYETPQEAADAARAFGERWLSEHEQQ
jgi:hypothetical protein